MNPDTAIDESQMLTPGELAGVVRSMTDIAIVDELPPVTPVLEARLKSDLVAFDYETYYDGDGCSVRLLGNDAYVRHPQFNPYLISVCDEHEAWAGEPKDFNWDSVDGCRLAAHNAAFEYHVTEYGIREGRWPRVNVKEWLCTGNMAAYLCDRRALDQSVEFLLGRRVDKGVRDRAKGKTVADMKAEGWWDDMLKYGRQDVADCRELFTRFGDQWPTFERRLSKFTIDQCFRGVFIDKERLHSLKEAAQTALIKAEVSLPWIARGSKPGSPIAIAEECRKEGIPPPPVKSHTDDGEELFEIWQNTFAPRYKWVAAITAYRRLNKFLGLVEKIEERLRPDGSLGFELKYYGAHSGRWSGGGGLNMQNFRSIPLLLDAEYVLNIDDDRETDAGQFYEDTGSWPEWVSHVLDIRSIFIPRSGYKFVISDLSQIEPRVLSWLVGNFDFLDLLKGGTAVYEAHARATMGWTGGKLKDEDKQKYKLAKARVLALGYQAAWEKFIVMAYKLAGLKIDEATSKAQVEAFRAENPKIVGTWERLNDEIRAARGGDYVIELPNGRRLNYGKVGTRVRTNQDPETKRIWKSYETTADVGGKRTNFYGGKLTENATQAVARDVFGEGLLRLEDAGIECVWTVHDEAITQVPLDCPAGEVRKLLAQTPAWLPDCPIDATAEDAERYKK